VPGTDYPEVSALVELLIDVSFEQKAEVPDHGNAKASDYKPIGPTNTMPIKSVGETNVHKADPDYRRGKSHFQ
jgi:hypothetical protein